MSYNIYLGNNIVDNIYLGNTEITEADLLGSVLNQNVIPDGALQFEGTEDYIFFENDLTEEYITFEN